MSEKMTNLLIINYLSVSRETLFTHILNFIIMKKTQVWSVINKLPGQWVESTMLNQSRMPEGISFVCGHYWYFPYRRISKIEFDDKQVSFRIQSGLFTFYFSGQSPHAMFYN